jgi:hypothetical protein
MPSHYHAIARAAGARARGELGEHVRDDAIDSGDGRSNVTSPAVAAT